MITISHIGDIELPPGHLVIATVPHRDGFLVITDRGAIFHVRVSA